MLALGVAVAIGIGIWAWVDDDTAGPERRATLTEITDNPGAWYGSTVTVSGEVDELAAFGGDLSGGAATQAGANPAGVAFTLGGDALGEQLLVIDAMTPNRFLDQDSVVQVRGTVRQFDAAAFNDSFGEQDWFDDPFFDDWGGRPAIVAQSLDPTVPRGS